MNSQLHNTASSGAARAPFDYRKFYEAIEEPIHSAAGRSHVLCMLADTTFAMAAEGGVTKVFEDQARTIVFMIEEVHRAVKALDEIYRETWPIEVASETERRGKLIEDRTRDDEELAVLLTRHRAAAIAFRSALDAAASANRSSASQTTGEKEARSLLDHTSRDLLSWRPRTLEGNAIRIKYLTDDERGLWRDVQPEEGELWLLFSSMMEKDA